MTESMSDLRDRLTAKYRLSLPNAAPPLPVLAPSTVETPERAFVISPPNSDKLYVTGRVKAEHWDTPVNRAFSYITGRYVQADKANLNGAFWSSDDLAFGAPSVAYGPVNMLHNDNAIVGTISEARLNENDETFGTHITTCNVLWKFLFPGPVQAIETASQAGELWQSMECVSDKVQCIGDVGCGEEFDYQTWMRNKSSACGHLSQPNAPRRLVRPTFLATGIILGSARPAWADADMEIRKESAKVAEDNGMYEGNMTKEFAENLVAQVLHWANHPA